MFSPKFVLKGNLQARTHVPPPPPHSRRGAQGARADVCHAAPGVHARVLTTELLHAHVKVTRVPGHACG